MGGETVYCFIHLAGGKYASRAAGIDHRDWIIAVLIMDRLKLSLAMVMSICTEAVITEAAKARPI